MWFIGKGGGKRNHMRNHSSTLKQLTSLNPNGTGDVIKSLAYNIRLSKIPYNSYGEPIPEALWT